ncbi:acid-sensing ion channel 5-like [Contarinia nasturtii]|uniref:acid-sensing ion channel 5-like n=1 Tax=Contarinia nasturtii TaxID=265458 RepID=UPI0012D39397|nr:acid-sensing ion channel 5-like [Contarinia nasturtii]
MTRLLWSMIIISACTSAVYINTIFLQRFFERPLVTFLERDYYEWNTTFPSFTLCGQEKINETALKLYLSEMNLAPQNKRKFEEFLRVLVNLTMFNLHTLSKFGDYESLPYTRVIDELTKKHDYDILIDSLSTLKLQRAYTELGICDQFNSEISQIFATDFLINDHLPAKKALYEVNYFDANPHIVLNDLDDSNIHFHGPFDLPQLLKKREISGSASQYKSFSLSAISVVAAKNVRTMYIWHRKCRYSDESDLVRFPLFYTYDLCKLECKINAIVEKCGCVPFFYKKLPHEKYCNIKKLLCVEFHKDDIDEAINTCECYRTCFNIKFSIQEKNSLNWLQENKLRVELNKPKMRLVRHALHSIADVIAGIGATNSLFLGVSIITLVEIIYFACIRRTIQRHTLLMGYAGFD